MSVNDSLGKRMKHNYEEVSKTRLTRRTPVAIRLDGKAFHTFTKGLKKPFDHILIRAMQKTTKSLCENIQGCVFGYTQSDEITLVLQDYKDIATEAWFDYEVQKMCSISASICTYSFNRFFKEEVESYLDGHDMMEESYFNALTRKLDTMAIFDARVFNIPKEEVANMIYWRQLDATRTSINMLGQANFSPKELDRKSCSMIQEMLSEQKGIKWDDLPSHIKRGSAVIKNEAGKWFIDEHMPLLINEDRSYAENRIDF